MTGPAPVARFVTRGGIRIYRMPIETFPGHVNNVYLILDGPHTTLFDVGSGLPDSNDALAAAFHEVRERHGEPVAIERVGHVVVSHAHIDHFGHVGYFVRESGARVYVHELDARVLESFEERVVLASKDVRVFLARAGVDAETRSELEAMYRFTKNFFKSVRCHVRLRDGDRIVNGYTVHHVPGHCPGHICLQVDDVLLAADHVLSRITPHQSPASITPFCGLDLYLGSLDKVRALPGVRLALPGHEAPVTDLPGRIAEIERHHRRRLGQVLDACREPRTLAAITATLFGPLDGYGRLLGLEEAGAHVEYLLNRAELAIANIGEVERAPDPVLLYETRRGGRR